MSTTKHREPDQLKETGMEILLQRFATLESRFEGIEKENKKKFESLEAEVNLLKEEVNFLKTISIPAQFIGCLAEKKLRKGRLLNPEKTALHFLKQCRNEQCHKIPDRPLAFNLLSNMATIMPMVDPIFEGGDKEDFLIQFVHEQKSHNEDGFISCNNRGTFMLRLPRDRHTQSLSNSVKVREPTASPESLCIVEMGSSEAKEETGEVSKIGALYLNIGLQNGVLLRTVLDTVTGDLSDTRTRYLGSRAVKLFRIGMQGSDAVLAMSSRSWLSYWYQNRFHLTPLSYETLEYSSGFSSEQCPEGIVAISSNTLRILALEKLGAVFNQVSTPLQYTTRKFVIHPESSNLLVIETDHNTYTDATKLQRKEQIAEEMVEAAGEEEQELAAEMAAAFLNENLPENIFSSPKAGHGMWASLIRIINPITGQTLDKVQLEQNEAAQSICVVKFSCRPDKTYVLVGTVKDLVLNPRSCASGFLHVYKIEASGDKLELVHKTPVEDVPGAITPYQGRVLIGVGKLLRIYDLGKKKLLRKCENKYISNMITSIQTMGHRIVVTDVQESFHFVRYRHSENQLIIFADDINPRWLTCSCILDYDTVAGADKFGNIAIVRLPSDCSDDDPTGNKALWDRGVLSGASQKADVLVNFHIGEVITSLQKVTLIPGGSESLVYTTLSGGIGMLVPFTSHEDHDFFQHLEMHMRSEYSPLCGRDHLLYRSYYFPVKNVIDGDLCEMFTSMDLAKQKSVADDLDRTPNEYQKN